MIALIPAKGTSTRVPGKNIRAFHGKPIIAYSVEAAQCAGLTPYVSTDDEKVSMVAQECGATVIDRPHKWTLDQYGPVDVARYHLEHGDIGNPDMVCIIYATAPMVRAADIIDAESKMRGHPAVGFIVSVGWEPLHDAAQFIWCKSWALRRRVPEFGSQTLMYPVPKDCDINTESDWKRAEVMYGW